MTTHNKRLQLMQRKGGNPPSIMSGGGNESVLSGSIYSGNQMGNYPPIADNSNYLKVATPKYNPQTGPCSSLISGKSQISKVGGASMLSINSQGAPIRPLAASKSLGGSKASMVSVKSFKTNIQQEYHDKKVKRKLNALSYGRASKPYKYFIICCIIGSFLLLIGLILMYLRYFGELFLTLDRSELIGPLFIVGAILLFGLAIKFLVDAYRIGAYERRRLGFRASGNNMVTVNKSNNNKDVLHNNEHLATGTTSSKALHKVPHIIHVPVGGESVLS